MNNAIKEIINMSYKKIYQIYDIINLEKSTA